MTKKKQQALKETFQDRLVAGNSVKLTLVLEFFLKGYKPESKAALEAYKEIVRQLKKFVRDGEIAKRAQEKGKQEAAKLQFRSEITQEMEFRTSYALDIEKEKRWLEETKRKIEHLEEEHLRQEQTISDGKEAKKYLAKLGIGLKTDKKKKEERARLVREISDRDPYK